MEILIISGLSGSGKSQVASMLEELDFYCVDNMPVSLIPKFAELCAATRGRYERVALVTDVRSRESFDELFESLDTLKSLGFEYKILYLDASIDTIVKRYKETRRVHPLDTGDISLEQAVNKEIKILEPIRKRADYRINTTDMTLGRLQSKVYSMFSTGEKNRFRIIFISFGYKYGIPIETDIAFDVRFLPNPFYVPELSEKSGLDKDVAEYVFKGGFAEKFTQKFQDLLEFLIPNYEEEGKLSLTVSIGCTGGRHRSVAVCEYLSKFFSEKGYSVECIHRDINKV